MKGWSFGVLSVIGVLSSARASAFCGFYVAPTDAPLTADATMVALMRHGTRTALTMSNNYKGPAADFAMVVPVPVVLHKEDVRTLPHDIFRKLEAVSAPRLVEYWEQDPCPRSGAGGAHAKGAEGMMGDPSKNMPPKAYGVHVEAQFAVDEYDVVVLGAEESDGLERWLRDHEYKIPNGASAALAPYVKEQMKFFVAKVDVAKVKRDEHGVAVLSPLRFHYESMDFRLPVRLGLLNAPAGSKQDLIVWTLAENTRFETANYPNVFIPTNIDVADETRHAFASFYASLFDATLQKAGNRAVVTEYAWASSWCDPCPTPPLTTTDVAWLGGDVFFGLPTATDFKPSRKQPLPPTPTMVLTRLHTRYDAATLDQDLVFRAAAPVVGGREERPEGGKEIEHGVQSSTSNSFQARYVIRHAWEGPLDCESPERGVWGGPPSPDAANATNAALGLAGAKRDVSFVRYAKSRVDELGVLGRPPGWTPEAPNPRWMRDFFLGVVMSGAVVLTLAKVLRKKDA